MVLPYDAEWLHIKQILSFASIVPPGQLRQPLENLGAAQQQDLLRQFEAFFWQYEWQIIGYLYQMTGDEQAANDLSQETFIRAWQHFTDIRGQATVRAWLYRVATNLALKFIQKRLARPQVVLAEDMPGQDDPSDIVVERDYVNEILHHLAPRYRSALLLFEVYDLPCAMIGSLLGMSRQAVKVTLWRAREQLRTLYREMGGEG